MDENGPRRIVPWLLVFLYFTFLYSYGAKLSTLVYTDFPSFYYGARLSFIEKQSPYNEQALTAASEKAEPPRPGEVRRRIYPYLYPPPSLLLFYPLARLPVNAAKIAVLAINHVCLLIAIGLLLVGILGFTPRQMTTDVLPAFMVIYLLFFRGIDSTIELGQVNLIVLALLCVCWLGIKRDWPGWAIALPLALASVFKLYPVLFLGMLVFRRKYQAAALTLALLAAVCIVSWFVLPRAFWIDWKTNVAPTCGYLRAPMGVFPPTLQGNVGFAGFMARLFMAPKLFMEVGRPTLGATLLPFEQLGRLLTVAGIAVMALITFGAVYLSSRRDAATNSGRGQRIDLEFAAILVLTFLVAPLAWEHHLTYVAPGAIVAMLAVLGRDGNRARGWIYVTIFLTAFVIAWPLTVAKLPLPRLLVILLASVKLYAVLILWGFLLVEMTRRKIRRSLREAAPI
ncbi:MAG TPA: glycosyltransferase family 87 protein [Tepidisphaeraceae bacterium]|nr:glycosyltransferase family 87 protein [Tepidisphaeraceae bacterium]